MHTHTFSKIYTLLGQSQECKNFSSHIQQLTNQLQAFRGCYILFCLLQNQQTYRYLTNQCAISFQHDHGKVGWYIPVCTLYKHFFINFGTNGETYTKWESDHSKPFETMFPTLTPKNAPVPKSANRKMYRSPNNDPSVNTHVTMKHDASWVD